MRKACREIDCDDHGCVCDESCKDDCESTPMVITPKNVTITIPSWVFLKKDKDEAMEYGARTFEQLWYNYKLRND